LAIGPLLLVGIVLAWQSFNAQSQQALALQREVAQRVATQVTAFFTGLENELRAVSQVQGLQGLDRDRQQAILSELLSYEDVFEELTLLDSEGKEQIRVSRLRLTFTELGNRAEEDEFVIPKTSGEVYYSSVRFREGTGEPLMTISLPLQDVRTGLVDAVLVSEVRIKRVWDLIAGIQVSQGQSVYIVDAEGIVVAHRNPSVVLGGAHFDVPDQDGTQRGLTNASVLLAVDTVRLGEQAFNVVAEQTTSEALAPATNSIIVILITVAVAAVAAVGLGLLVVRQIVHPIQAMAATVQAISSGDLSQQVQVTSQDEVGALATAFNDMTVRLRGLIAGLEGRTHALETSTKVSRRLSTILDQEQLVTEVVQQVQTAFNYYHVHIYLIDETTQDLVMAGGTGTAGQMMLAGGHKIPTGRGLTGRAAATNSPVLVPDVSQEEGWLPNPLLPETKSEVAVPIAMGERVLGVLDVQHNVTGGLGEADTSLLQSIAGQVAIALQNIRLFAEAQRRAEHQTRVNLITQRIQSTTTVEDALQVAVRELGRAVEAGETSVRLA
jgi:putative methionine-R-sulfoxide reductase with GAF domain